MTDGGNVKPLVFDCVACQAAASDITPEQATTTILVMLVAETDTVISMRSDLCTLHFRQVSEAASKQRQWYRDQQNEE